jgi:hypothetical protein
LILNRITVVMIYLSNEECEFQNEKCLQGIKEVLFRLLELAKSLVEVLNCPYVEDFWRRPDLNLTYMTLLREMLVATSDTFCELGCNLMPGELFLQTL